MNRSVNLKHYIQFGTVEISNISVNYLLPSPFQVFNLSIA